MKTKRILKAGFNVYSNPFIETDLPKHLIPPKEERSSEEWSIFKKDEEDTEILAATEPIFADIYPEYGY